MRLRRRRGRMARRLPNLGVSEIIGSLLILAITVALFGAMFIFVSRAQPPSTPPPEQFAVSLNVTSSGIVGISIQLVSGQAISGPTVSQAYIHLQSQAKPSAIPAQLTLAAGLPGGKSIWSPGANWTYGLASYALPNTDQLTVVIGAGGKLLLQEVAPGPSVTIAPYVTSTWTYPAPVPHKTNFTISATIVIPNGLGATGSVKVNLSNIPGEPSSLQVMTYSSSTGVWSFQTTAAPTTARSTPYYANIYVTDQLGETAFASVPVTVT